MAACILTVGFDPLPAFSGCSPYECYGDCQGISMGRLCAYSVCFFICQMAYVYPRHTSRVYSVPKGVAISRPTLIYVINTLYLQHDLILVSKACLGSIPGISGGQTWGCRCGRHIYSSPGPQHWVRVPGVCIV